MYKIERISSDPLQKRTLILPDGTQTTFTMYYSNLQLGWFIKELTWQDFTLNGLRISNSPNLLYQFKNQLTFGMACISGNIGATATMREPTQIEDFSSGFSTLYILDALEVAEYTRFVIGQT